MTLLWYDALGEPERKQLRSTYEAAAKANVESFSFLDHEWNTQYIKYLYAFLEGRDDHNSRQEARRNNS